MAEAEATESLTDEQQLFIVVALACFKTPTEVSQLVKEEFSIDVSRQKVQYYDPTKGKDKGLAQKHKAIFAKARKDYIAGVASVGIAHQRYRLEHLEAMALAAEKAKNYGLAAQLHEQAAKERGGFFTNKQEQNVSIKGEISLPMTLKDWKARAEQRRGQAKEAMETAAADEGAKRD